MSEETQGARPGQATLAGWLIIGGSLILLVTAWDRISGLGTLEVQEGFRKALGEPPLDGTGLSLSDLSSIVRVASMVAAAAATAAAILGFHALRRSRSARVALTCLVPVLLVAGFAVGGFFAPMVAAGVVLLWLAPTRDWFAGRPWSNAGPSADRKEERPDPFAAPPPDREEERRDPFADRTGVGGPASYHGVSQAPPAQQTFAMPGGEQDPQQPALPTAPGPRPSRGPRPGGLVAACVITWAVAGLVALLMGLTALAMGFARDELFDEFERQQPDFDYQGLERADLAIAVIVLAAVIVVWCLAAIVLAALAFRGLDWARITLVVSSAGAGLVCLAGALANPMLIVVVIATGATVGMLLRRDVADWFRRAPR